jgi:hypothetical protein
VGIFMASGGVEGRRREYAIFVGIFPVGRTSLSGEYETGTQPAWAAFAACLATDGGGITPRREAAKGAEIDPERAGIDPQSGPDRGATVLL